MRIWICTFMNDFPMKVAEKKVLKGIPKWPQASPARSKNGFGIEANIKIVINPYFLRLVKINSFTSSEVSYIPYCLDN